MTITATPSGLHVPGYGWTARPSVKARGADTVLIRLGGRVIALATADIDAVNANTYDGSQLASEIVEDIYEGLVPPPAAVPVNTDPPSISGTLLLGQTLTCSTGTWTNSPTSYSYQWYKDAVLLVGETNNTYVPVDGDQFGELTCAVVATNLDGNSSPRLTVGAIVGLILDIESSKGAWSVYKLRTAYAGACMRIRRSSDNSEQDIPFNASGYINESAITSFVGSGSAFVVKWYDQSGNSEDLVNANAATQPRVVNAGALDKTNGRLTVKFRDVFSTANLQVPSSAGRFLFMRDGTNSSAFSVYKKGGTSRIVAGTGQAGGGNWWQIIEWTDNKAYCNAYHSAGVDYNYVGSCGTTTVNQQLVTFYVDANNGKPAQRASGYLNGGAVVNDNTYSYGTYSGNNLDDFTLGNRPSKDASIGEIQEFMLFDNQPTLSVMRAEINSRFEIY